MKWFLMVLLGLVSATAVGQQRTGSFGLTLVIGPRQQIKRVATMPASSKTIVPVSNAGPMVTNVHASGAKLLSITTNYVVTKTK